MPKIDLDAIAQTNATGYPAPYDAPVTERWYRRLAPATGLTDFAASHAVLKPGAWSSQRHWHNGEDEFLIMIAGEAVLVEDDGRTMLRAGGGAERDTGGGYSEIDMLFADGGYFHKDGTPYAAKRVP